MMTYLCAGIPFEALRNAQHKKGKTCLNYVKYIHYLGLYHKRMTELTVDEGVAIALAAFKAHMLEPGMWECGFVSMDFAAASALTKVADMKIVKSQQGVLFNAHSIATSIVETAEAIYGLD